MTSTGNMSELAAPIVLGLIRAKFDLTSSHPQSEFLNTPVVSMAFDASAEPSNENFFNCDSQRRPEQDGEKKRKRKRDRTRLGMLARSGVYKSGDVIRQPSMWLMIA